MVGGLVAHVEDFHILPANISDSLERGIITVLWHIYFGNKRITESYAVVIYKVYSTQCAMHDANEDKVQAQRLDPRVKGTARR